MQVFQQKLLSRSKTSHCCFFSFKALFLMPKIFKILHFKFFFEESALRTLEEKGLMRSFPTTAAHYIIGSFFLAKVTETPGIMINFVCPSYDLHCSFSSDGTQLNSSSSPSLFCLPMNRLQLIPTECRMAVAHGPSNDLQLTIKLGLFLQFLVLLS